MIRIFLFLLIFPAVLAAQESNEKKYLAFYLEGHMPFAGIEIGFQNYITDKIDMLVTVQYDDFKMGGLGRKRILFNQKFLFYNNSSKKGLFYASSISLGNASFDKTENRTNYYSMSAHALKAGGNLGWSWHLSKRMRVNAGLSFSIQYLHYYSSSISPYEYYHLDNQPFLVNNNLEFLPEINIGILLF